MTRDEILNMEAGREMDALVWEKVMGWNFIADSASDRVNRYWSDPATHDAWTVEMRQPSQLIQHAFQIIEKITEVDASNDFKLETTATEWRCTFNADFIEYLAYGKTAPLAICRAVLLAVMK